MISFLPGTGLIHRANGVAAAYIARPDRDPNVRLYSEGAGKKSTPLVDSVIAAKQDMAGPEVLELGAGRGVHAFTLARRLNSARVVAVDTNPEYVAHINELSQRTLLANGSVVEATLANAVTYTAGLEPESQDVVTSNSLDHVIPTAVRVEAHLPNISRALRKGGITGASYKADGDVQHRRGEIIYSDERGDYVQDPDDERLVRLIVKNPKAIIDDYARAGLRVVAVYGWGFEGFDGIPGKSKFVGFKAVKE